MSLTMNLSWVAEGQSDGDDDKGTQIVKYTEAAMRAITEENAKGLRVITQRLATKPMTEKDKIETLKELEDLFYGFSSQQISIAMQALTLCFETTQKDVGITPKVLGEATLNEDVESSEPTLNQGVDSREPSWIQSLRSGESTSNQDVGSLIGSPLPESSSKTSSDDLFLPIESQNIGFLGNEDENKTYAKLLPSSAMRKKNRNWSETWRKAVEGVLQNSKYPRERIREVVLTKMESFSKRKVVPKSEGAKERLRKILSTHFLLGDLDDSLREEIVDAFQDLRVGPGTEVMKAGETADFFYVIDVGEVEVLMKKGNEPTTPMHSKGAGESFGELALMYDTVRNVTVKTKTHCLLWSVDRPTFKSTISRHLSGSQIAQVLREVPALKKLPTRDIVALSTHCSVQRFSRGQQIMQAGTHVDKVFVIQEGQVRMSWGVPVAGKLSGVGGDTVAMMNRLEVLGEALLLNDDTLNPWNYVASSDHVELIMMNRSLFDSDILKSIRKGLQMQFIILALQRVPLFLELDYEQLSNLAEQFTESTHKRGQEIMRMGDASAIDARLYVVLKGTLVMQKWNPSPEARKSSDATNSTLINSWGSRLGSLLKSPSQGGSLSIPPPPPPPPPTLLKSPSGSNIILPPPALLKSPSGSNTILPPPALLKSPSGDYTIIPPPPSSGSKSSSRSGSGSGASSTGSPSPSSSPVLPWLTQSGTDISTGDRKSRSSSLTSEQSWSITTYSVFGEECLQDDIRSSSPTCQSTMVVDSGDGAICLSVSLTEMTCVLGPIQEFLARVANLSVLRKVPCLEYLTCPELDMLSHSMGLRKVKPGEVIYRPGEPGDRLYVVHKGTVVESTKSPKDGKVEEQILVAGSFFGEAALLTAEPRSQTTISGTAISPSAKIELYYLDRGVLEANLGPLEELYETRKANAEKNGIVKKISFEELEVMGLLGTGLFGKVKLVYSQRMNEFYALKCVKKAQVVKMHEEEHLRNEKINMSELDHPFITKLVRTFKDEKHIYLLQQLTIGKELFQFMEKVGRLQEWEASFYAGAVLLALEYMHGKGIAYRDLKPENTLIGENGYPKLIDMGFAKRIYNRKTFSMCGTPDYMAPEIIKRQGHGKAVDFWALGCLIFEMITNTSAFNRGSDPPQVVFQNITEGRFRCPPNVSPTAVDIITQLLDPNPETRLGCRPGGIIELKQHPFFTREIDFQLLLRQKEEAPMIPPKVKDYRALCIIDKQPEDQYENMNILSQHNPAWDDIF
ncbi:unnamed protein product [Calypogeia fissa]